MHINRRGVLVGLGALLAAPAIVRAGVLMPVKVIKPVAFDWAGAGFTFRCYWSRAGEVHIGIYPFTPSTS